MAGPAQLAELFEVSVATTKSGGLTISVQTSHNIHCALIVEQAAEDCNKVV